MMLPKDLLVHLEKNDGKRITEVLEMPIRENQKVLTFGMIPSMQEQLSNDINRRWFVDPLAAGRGSQNFLINPWEGSWQH